MIEHIDHEQLNVINVLDYDKFDVWCVL